MKRALALALFIISVCGLALCQGTTTSQRIVITDSLGRPLGGISVEVCTTASQSSPSCQAPASIYSDAALSQPITCTGATTCLTTDSLGQVPTFFASPGYYCYAVSGSYISDTSCKLIVLYSASAGSAVIANQNNTLTGNNSFTGISTFDPSSNSRLIVDTANDVHVFTGISPIQPAPQAPTTYPLGNDLVLDASGSADLHLKQIKVATTTTATLSVGANNNVLVGSTTNFAPSQADGGASGMYLLVGWGTANYEVVTTYHIVDGTHLNLTCTKTHNGTTDIEQIGSVFLDVRRIITTESAQPSQSLNTPIVIEDQTQGNTLLTLPVDSNAPFPNNSLMTYVPLTGGDLWGAATIPAPLKLRNANASNGVALQNSDGSANMTATDNQVEVFTTLLVPNAVSITAGNGNLVLTGPIASGSPTGRLGLDATGSFLTSDTNGKALRFLVNNGSTVEGGRFNTNGRFTIGAQTGSSGGGVDPDGGGFKHKRGTAGCATGASAGAQCTTTISWTTAFADANYTVTCQGDGVTSGVPTLGGLTAKIAASITIQTTAVTAAAAQFTNIECIAVHD